MLQRFKILYRSESEFQLRPFTIGTSYPAISLTHDPNPPAIHGSQLRGHLRRCQSPLLPNVRLGKLAGVKGREMPMCVYYGPSDLW